MLTRLLLGWDRGGGVTDVGEISFTVYIRKPIKINQTSLIFNYRGSGGSWGVEKGVNDCEFLGSLFVFKYNRLYDKQGRVKEQQ